MNIAVVDQSATRGHSALHRAVPVAKLVAFGLLLTAVMVSTNLLVVLSLTGVLAAIALWMRLPSKPIFALSAYPGLFASLFAFAASAGWLGGALIVAKAVTAALAAVLLMFTTPYPQVFAPVQRVVPAVIGDALLMTYRSLFILLEKFSHTLTAVRLRAGVVGHNPVRSAGSHNTLARGRDAVLHRPVTTDARRHAPARLRRTARRYRTAFGIPRVGRDDSRMRSPATCRGGRVACVVAGSQPLCVVPPMCCRLQGLPSLSRIAHFERTPGERG